MIFIQRSQAAATAKKLADHPSQPFLAAEQLALLKPKKKEDGSGKKKKQKKKTSRKRKLQEDDTVTETPDKKKANRRNQVQGQEGTVVDTPEKKTGKRGNKVQAKPEGGAKEKVPNAYNAFMAVHLKDAQFMPGQHHKQRFKAVVELWRAQLPAQPPGAVGCSKCRRSANGCKDCNPAKRLALQ